MKVEGVKWMKKAKVQRQKRGGMLAEKVGVRRKKLFSLARTQEREREREGERESKETERDREQKKCL